MRIARSVFVGSMAALALLTAPALAKNSNAQKADDKPASSSCHAYQRAPDGSWIALPVPAARPSRSRHSEARTKTLADREASALSIARARQL